MAIDLIRYDLLVQEALRSVVRKVLSDAVRDGLPGDHHFYITFKTHAAGVQLSKRMREEYPVEMTIILQHQFYGLKVTENGFEVGLSFHKIPETLIIPFDALTGFFDPSVQFGLKFEIDTGANDSERPRDTVLHAVEGGRDLATAGEEENVPAASSATGLLPVAHPAADDPEPGQSKVISIDAFRKKP